MTLLQCPARVASQGSPVNHVTEEGAQGSVAAVAYRRDPTGEFPKRFLDGFHALLQSMVNKNMIPVVPKECL